MEPCVAPPIRANMAHTKKEPLCHLQEGVNKESVTIPFAVERALTKCLRERNLRNVVEWAVSTRL